jgi:hypothetical protein
VHHTKLANLDEVHSIGLHKVLEDHSVGDGYNIKEKD